MIHNFASLQMQSNRKKDVIWNLSELLGQNSAKTPERAVAERSVADNAIKQSKTSNLIAKKQTTLRTISKSATRMNSQHYRIKSSIKGKNQYLELKQQNLLKIDLRKKIDAMKLRRSSSMDGFGVEKQSGINPFRMKENLGSERQFQGLKIKQLKKGDRELRTLLSLKSGSQELGNGNESQNCNNSSSRNKKEFLKKGTSLQKQIVLNLLKNKMIRQHQLNIEKQYSVKDIEGMVKLYKGIPKGKDPTFRQRQSVLLLKNRKIYDGTQSDGQCPLNIVQQFQKPIDGWKVEQQQQLSFVQSKDHKQSVDAQDSLKRPGLSDF